MSRILTYSLTALLLIFLGTSRAFGAGAPVDTFHLWTDDQVLYGSEVLLCAYRPEKPNGTAIIVCPGGSYCWLDDVGEGAEVAEFLRSNGITAFVLLYRTAGFGAFFWHYRYFARGNRHPDMITDAQRALQWVNEHSGEYDLDTSRIGMMGFSAGGHLVMSAACFSATDFLAPVGVEADFNRRPAFVAPIYPVVTMQKPYVHKRSRRALLGDNKQHNKQLMDSLSLEMHIPQDCPPVFIVNCKDDPVVDYQNSELLDSALTAAGVCHRYIQYETGMHGFGVSEVYGSPECRKWKYEFLKWLSEID
jgi:Esterase/lipase